MGKALDENVVIRDWVKATDESFVYSTWLIGLYYGNPWYGEIEKDTYMRNYHKILENILNRPGVEVKVACYAEDPDIILGYSVTQNDVLHWVYVKHAWRKFGIAKKLVPENIEFVTHLTNVGKSLLPEKMTFDPFLI